MDKKTAVALPVRPKYVDYSSAIKIRCVLLSCEILAEKILDRKILERKKVVR